MAMGAETAEGGRSAAAGVGAERGRLSGHFSSVTAGSSLLLPPPSTSLPPWPSPREVLATSTALSVGWGSDSLMVEVGATGDGCNGLGAAGDGPDLSLLLLRADSWASVAGGVEAATGSGASTKDDEAEG